MLGLMNSVAGWHALRQDQGGQEMEGNCIQEPSSSLHGVAISTGV